MKAMKTAWLILRRPIRSCDQTLMDLRIFSPILPVFNQECQLQLNTTSDPIEKRSEQATVIEMTATKVGFERDFLRTCISMSNP